MLVFHGVRDGIGAHFARLRGVHQLAVNKLCRAFATISDDRQCARVDIVFAIQVGVVRQHIQRDRFTFFDRRTIFVCHWRRVDNNGHRRFVGDVAVFVFHGVRDGGPCPLRPASRCTPTCR
ncbi:Uncharacterised protein [Providencia rustigianii]|nr:Uncharacterised protein [Providencia rustigianii]